MKKTTSQRRTATSTEATASAAEEQPENLDKVRDILFGGQMRAVDSRLAALEERFQRDLERVRGEAAKQVSNLETYINKELQAHSEQIKTERAKRGDDLKALGSDLKTGINDLERRLAKLDETTAKSDADLRTAILEHSKTVAADLKKLSDDIGTEFDRVTHELRSEKLDTASLIELFSDMALRLTEDLQAPPASG